jgi:hypothetical protein
MEKKPKKKYVYDHKDISVRFSQAEWQELNKNVANSTCRSIAEYVRKATMGKPLGLFYRNKSFDLFVDECILLRNEMRLIREKMPPDSSGIDRLLTILENINQLIAKLVDHVCKDQNL